MPGTSTISWIKNLPQLAAPVLTAVSASTTQIDLSWVDVSNESSYKIEWSASGVGGWTQIGGTIAAGSTSYSHTGASAATLYFYRITAVGDNINFIDSGFGYANERTRGTALSIVQSVTGSTTTTGSIGIALTGVVAGNFLIYLVGQTDNSVVTPPPPSITSSPSITWKKLCGSPGGTLTGNTDIWGAFFAAGGSITCTAAWGSTAIAGVVSEISGVEAVLLGAQAYGIAQTNPSVDIETTRYGSIVFGVTSDYNTNDGATRTLRDTATELFYFRSISFFTGYFYYKQCTVLARKTLGLSAPTMTGAGAGTSMYEVRTA